MNGFLDIDFLASVTEGLMSRPTFLYGKIGSNIFDVVAVAN